MCVYTHSLSCGFGDSNFFHYLFKRSRFFSLFLIVQSDFFAEFPRILSHFPTRNHENSRNETITAPDQRAQMFTETTKAFGIAVVSNLTSVLSELIWER